MGRKKKEFELITVAYNECQFHPSFTAKMINQLTESGSKLLEDSLINCVCALFIHEDQVKFDSDGNGYIKGNIIDWRSFGRDVTVKWSSPAKTNIYPDYDVDELDITFSWCEDFPSESLKMRSKKKVVKIDSVTYPFNVEFLGYIESDIYLEIGLNNPENEDCKQLIIDTLENAFDSWNINVKKTNGESIHYMGDLKKSKNRYVLYIDLGSSGIEAINFLISTLANKVESIGISRIIVKQA